MEKIRSIHSMLLVLVLGLFPLFARDGVEIEYNPTRVLRNSLNLPLEITVSNFSGIPVAEIQVWYRWVGEGRFQMIPMRSEGFSYQTSIDVSENDNGLLEYYFAILYADRRRETYPSEAPASGLLQTTVQPMRNYGDQIVIVSPEPAEQIFNTDIIITASFSSIASMVDVERTKLYLNTWDVSQYLDKYGDFVSFAPRTVPSGRHKIRMELYNPEGNLVASREWTFNALATAEPEPVERGWRVNGRFFAELRQEDLGRTDLKQDYNQSGLQLRGRYQNWDIGGRVYISNLESSGRQPVNRYAGYARLNFWNGRFVNLEFGDTYPKLNPMLMQNIFLRGLYARMHLKFLNVDFATGTTRRAIEGDSTISRFGTFKREVTTIRPSFGAGDQFQVGLTYLKGKDQTGSIAFGQSPEENAAAGIDMFLGLDNNRVIFEGNFNASAYNPNITGGNIPFDTLVATFEDIDEEDRDYYDRITDFITVNQYLIPEPGMAYQARLMLRYFRNNFSFIYESVDEDFFSLGQPYLLRDNRGFRLVDNINLVRNQLFLTVGYRRYQNNLQNIKNHTTTNQTVHANLSYFPIGNLPEISIGYNNYSRDNDVPADSIGSILNRPEDNKTTTFTVSGGYRFQVSELNNRFGVDLVSYQRDDIFATAQSNSDYLNISLRSQFRVPLQTLLEFILQQTESGADTETASQLDLTTFGLGARYIFGNLFTEDRLTLQGNARFGNVKSEYQLAGLADSDYTRNYFSFKVFYSIPRYGNLGLVADILAYGGDRNYSDFIYTLRYNINF